MSTELVIPPYHLTLCCPLLLLLLRDPPCGFRNGGKEAEGGGELRAANGQGESQQGCHTLAVGPFSVPAEPYITVPPQRRGLSPLRCHFLCGVSLESLGVLSFHPLKNWQSSWALFWDCHVHLGLRDILSVVSTCVDWMEHERLIYLTNTEGSQIVSYSWWLRVGGTKLRRNAVCPQGFPVYGGGQTVSVNPFRSHIMGCWAKSDLHWAPLGLLLFRICVVQTQRRQAGVDLFKSTKSLWLGPLGAEAIPRGHPPSPVCPRSRLIFPHFPYIFTILSP